MRLPPACAMHAPGLHLHPSHPHGHTVWACACTHKVGALAELIQDRRQRHVGSWIKWPHSPGGCFTSLPPCLFHIGLSNPCLSVCASLPLFLGLSSPFLSLLTHTGHWGLQSSSSSLHCAVEGYPAEFLGLISIWPPDPQGTEPNSL